MAKRIRIVHVAECIGGVERFLRCLMKYTTYDRYENILILSQHYHAEEYKNLVEHVEIMKMYHNIGIVALKTAKDLRIRIKKYHPDVVVAHSSMAGAFTRMACMGMGCKILYNPHGWSFNMDSKKKNLYIYLEKIMSHFCDAIICISDAEKNAALDKKICKENMLHVIYNGIDIDEINVGNTSLEIPDDAYVVGMVGRICKQKAPDVFIKMAAEVKKEIDNAVFVIVGDVIEEEFEERKKIEELAESLGVKLFITGWVTNPISYMSRFDVGCLLSRWEGFGLVIPEYMLQGIPIVSTKVDAIPYLITDEKDGLLVEKDDWRMASIKVVSLARDKEKREKLISNGKLTVRERFDARRVAKEYEELYEELVE